MAVAGVGPRKHVVIVSKECLSHDDMNAHAELGVLASRSDQFELYFTSSEQISPVTVNGTKRNFTVSCKHRPTLREFIRNCGKVVIICGTVKEDMHIAAYTKSFLIAAWWAPLSEEVRTYGIRAPTPTKMRALIEIVANQTGWYYSCTFNRSPVPTKVVSLCLANTYSGVSGHEEFMAKSFRAILKDDANNPVIKEALFCHVMAAIAHDNDFREVEDWVVAPSSSGLTNPVMEELKERVRRMMNGTELTPIFVRHTPASKSRDDDPIARQHDNNYCKKHFKSICVDDHYRGELKGRVVCVLDDYLTHGNTFEALRNLLVACGVRKIIFVSVGKFRSSGENFYTQKDFCIVGDVHTASYTASFKRSTPHYVQFDDDARTSIKNLIKLASNLVVV